MKKDFSILPPCPLFAGIDESQLPTVLSCLDAVEKAYPRGTAIWKAGDPALRIGILLQGRAQVVSEDVFGNRSILGEIVPGELFGEAFACAGAPRIPVGVTAQADSAVLFVDFRKVLAACAPSCQFHHQLVENMVRILAEKNRMLNQKIRYLSKRTTREKLLAYLSDQAKAAGSRTFTIPFRRQELADFLCVERSAMSAQLGQLRREGVLDFDKSTFRLL